MIIFGHTKTLMSELWILQLFNQFGPAIFYCKKLKGKKIGFFRRICKNNLGTLYGFRWKSRMIAFVTPMTNKQINRLFMPRPMPLEGNK